MDIPDSGVGVPSHVQSFLGKVKQFIESTGGKVEFFKAGPPAPIYSDRATGAACDVQYLRLKRFVHGRFGNN